MTNPRTAMLQVGLPCAIAIFPQEMSIATSELEGEFQVLKDTSGRPVTHVFCNKGL
jgi:hypothetical protein